MGNDCLQWRAGGKLGQYPSDPREVESLNLRRLDIALIEAEASSQTPGWSHCGMVDDVACLEEL
eukprot:1159275-Pelagomonas_calceolata.AAC.4